MIVGRWQKGSGDEAFVVEFLPNGSATLGPGTPMPINANYGLLDDETLHLQFEVEGQRVTQKLKIKLSENELVTTDEENTVDRFVRLEGNAIDPTEAGKPTPTASTLVPADWKAFTSKELEFTGMFPAAVQEDSSKDPDGNTTHAFIAEPEPGIAYGVTCVVFPDDLRGAAREVLDGITASYDMESIKSRRLLLLDGHPGLEIILQVTEEGVPVHVANRFFVVKNRVYTLVVSAQQEMADRLQTRAFFESFQLLKPGSAKAAPGLPTKPLPRPAASGTSLKGEMKTIQDIEATEIKLSAHTTLGCLTWADAGGSAFFALDADGTLRRVSYPALEEEWTLALEQKGAWLSRSAQGLLVTLPDVGEVWLIDPATAKMKQRFAVPSVKRAVSAPGSSFGVAGNGGELFVLDLRNGTSTRFAGTVPRLIGWDRLVMTPDGRYLFTTGGIEQMHRFALDGGTLHYEQSSAQIAQGRVDTGVQVSPDSKWVCFSAFAGNHGTTKLGDLLVFPVNDIEKPAFTLSPGGLAVGFDPAGGYIYTQCLRLFDAGGRFLREYPVETNPAQSMKQILVHPAGNALIAFTGDRLSAVAVPKR
jgi:hypothetical protein